MEQTRHHVALDRGPARKRLELFVLGALAALISSLSGCVGIEPIGGDDTEDLSQLSTYRAEMKMASRIYTSELAPNPQIELWINPNAAPPYARVRPDAKGANVDLPEGTLIVREVLSAGKVAKLTVMGKGPLGSNPVVGDWWFAVTTPEGVPIVENGQELLGKLPQCVSCHDARGAADDYLFGVPGAAKATL